MRPKKLDWVVVLLVVVSAVLLAVLSVLRFNGYNSSMFDIGNMSQAIWSVTQGFPLEFTWEHGNFSRLALHVELVYVALAGLYAVFPDPRGLLVFQAVLFSLGAVPVYRIAARRFSEVNYVRALVLVYLLYPTANTAVLFDLHGDTLAMPVLMFVINALDRKAWPQYAAWIALALACKFYVSVPIIALGLMLVLGGRRRAGLLTAGAGLLWFLFVVAVIRPAYAPLSDGEVISGDLLSYVSFYFGGLGRSFPWRSLLPRVAMVFLVMMPAIVFGRLASMWLIPGLVTALPALLSTGTPTSYDYRFHHYALTVPFFVMAVICGIRAHSLGDGSGPSARKKLTRALVLQLLISVEFYILLVDAPLNPWFWSRTGNWGLSDNKYGQTTRDRFKDRWLLENVPDGAPIATTDILAPHLVNRRTLYLIPYSKYTDEQRELFLENLQDVEYVVADALYDFSADYRDGTVAGGLLHYSSGIRDILSHPDFRLTESRDGLLLFSRVSEGFAGLSQSISTVPGGFFGDYVMRFGDSIALVQASAEPVGDCRYRLRFEWAPLAPMSESAQLVAVSHLRGVDHSRYPHLPTMVLHPTYEWQEGTVLVEEFEVALPRELGSGTYELLTGWYDPSMPEAHYTDSRSRVDDELYTLSLECP